MISVDQLRKIYNFSALPGKVLQQLAENAYERRFAAGETVFTMSQYDGEELFCLLSGTAQFTGSAADTGALSVEEIATGDVVGLEYVLGNSEELAFQTSLTATSDLHVAIIESHLLRDIVKSSPAAARAFLASFARQLMRAKAGKVASNDDPHKRIYIALFGMVERSAANPAEWAIAQMPKHRELGELAGASEAEAAEAVAGLISKGIARRNYPGLVVEDYDALQALTV